MTRIKPKSITPALALIALGILLFLCIKRWHAWFGNPIEPPYASSNIPARIQLGFGNDGPFSRSISWQCGDTAAASQLVIVRRATLDTTLVSAHATLLHTQGGVTVSYRAEPTGLTGGIYTYSVRTGDRQSAWYDFTVSADSCFRFVYLGDIQDVIGGGGKTHNLLASINRRESDAAFWMLGGDVVERPHDQYWNEYFTAMDSIAQTKAIVACPGNHEYIKGISGKLEERFVHVFSYLADSRVNGHAVFDMRYGNTAIITLDSNCDTWKLYSQRSWFKQALERAKDAKWKIVLLHHPLYSVRGKMRHFFIRRMFDPLIREYGVDIVLQGHEHCYARMITKNKNNVPTRPLYLTSQFSPKDYRFYFDGKYDRFGNGLRFYQTLDVAADTLSLKTFTENAELYDDVRIVKTGNNLQLIDSATDIPEYFDPDMSRIHIKGAERERFRKEMEERRR
ncbi:MAG: metallophosphoesterase [Dysgonamonadaceae bacterium]|jgi:hypothetical protein|nr:metallophosphoesterase [Dysgonamonadaceae bacterium]